MRDISFAIPIRVDTPDRVENCDAILRFLTRHFPEAEIQLVEQDVETKTAWLRGRHPGVVWHFEFNDRHFSRSSAINTGLLRSTRRCVCAYDTDILLDPVALRAAAAHILAGRWPIVIPFNLIFVELSGARRKLAIDDLNITGLNAITRLDQVPHHPEITSRVLSGAIMMCDREIAIEHGGYNRKMVSYGWEDIEFFKRFEKLGFYSHIVGKHNLIHLDHRRGPDSRINEMYQVNKAEYDRVLTLEADALDDYVRTELSIAAAKSVAEGRRRRRARAIRNALTLRWPAHILNKALVLWQINGAASLARRALGMMGLRKQTVT